MHSLAQSHEELRAQAPKLYTDLVSAMGPALQTLGESDKSLATFVQAEITTFRKRRFDDSHRQRWYWDSGSAVTEVVHNPANVLTAWERRNLHNPQRPRKTDVTLDMPTDNGRMRVKYQGFHPDGAQDNFTTAWYRPQKEVLAIDALAAEELGFAAVVSASHVGIGMMLPDEAEMVYVSGPNMARSLDLAEGTPFARGNGDRQIICRYGIEGLADQYATFTLQALACIAGNNNGQNS